MTQPLHTRRSVLGALAAASLTLGCGGGSATEPTPTPEPTARPPGAAERGIRWLLAQQTEDGRFASATYGFLAGGASLTPFVLNALLTAPPEQLQTLREPIARALVACLNMADDAGALGFGGPAPDYPVYATSLTLRCLGLVRPDGWQEAAAPLEAWLRGQQFGRAWRGHPALGGFGMGWREAPSPPNAGHVDLSMTRRALEALRICGAEDGDVAFRLANRFVASCQAADGGFLYSPVERALNKGHIDGDVRASYGTATADGLLASFAIFPGWDARHDKNPLITRGLERLRALHRVDENPGVRGGPMEPFAVAMTGYYRAAAARVFASAGGPPGWQAPLVTAIEAEQHDDGRWESASPLQKENDPLIATAFAITALHHAG
mgnify:CR=1 FL=1